MPKDNATLSAASAGSTAVPFAPYYQDEAVTIYNADCRKVLPFLDRFDLLLTDPPYGIGYGGKQNSVGGTEGRARNGWRTWKTDWDESPPPRWMIDMIQDSADHAIVWGGNYYALPPSMGWLVWDKGQRDFSLADAELAWTNRNKAVRCFDYSRGEAAKDDRVHPTQKPVALMRWCLGLVPDAATVLDPFMGSGTTLVACKLDGRKAVGIEINEGYCEAAANRLRQGVLF
jgi:DNA modification methylase